MALKHGIAMNARIESSVAAGSKVVSPLSSLEGRWTWLQTWLAFAVFFYPLFWISNTALWTGPALIRVAVLGERVEAVDLTPWGARVATITSSGVAFFRPSRSTGGADSFSLGVLVVLALATALLLDLRGRKVPTASGFALATMSDAALAPCLAPLIFSRQISAQNAFGILFFFALLCLGLRWMLRAWNAVSFARRFGNLFAGFVLLPALTWLLLGLHFHFWPYPLLLVVPGAVAAVLVSLRTAASSRDTPKPAGWKLVACGLASSLVFAFGVPRGQAAIERSRLAANRRALAAYPKTPENLPYPRLFFQKGVSFTAEFPGGYASARARRMLGRLPPYGVNAVAIIPYGFTRGKSITYAGSLESDEGVEEVAQVAHALGMKVLLKPGMWTDSGYAGDLNFSSVGDRDKWFAQYKIFLEHYAQLATRIHADVFCVGGEFVKLSPDDADWRKLIARARQLFPGPLVYGANFGQEFETITFWDALDYIGLQEYYPLPDGLSTDSVVDKVEAVERKYQRPVIFTEAGFPSYSAPNRAPWDDRAPGMISLDDQARCYEAIFRAFYAKPWFYGVYWWKVGTNGFGGPEDSSLTPWGKPAMDVMKQWYLERGR